MTIFAMIIRYGKVVDGSGQKAFSADIGIADGRITAIAPRLETPAAQTINAAGCVVCPGFIDMHSHSDFTLRVYPRAESKVHQGVTTEVVGNCGGSPAPVPRASFDDFMQYMVGLGNLYQQVLAPDDWHWETLSCFYDELAGSGSAVNIVPLVGHSTLRCAAMGYESKPPSATQLKQMKRLLARELDLGAFGLSSGLIYHPGAFANRAELAALAKVVHEYEGIYTTHLRSESNDLLDAIAEAIYVAEQSGVSVQISHFKCEGPANHGKAGAALQHIIQAKDKGLQVDFDQYPYRAYQCGLLEIFPTRAKKKGNDRMLAILRQKELRQKVFKEMTCPPFDWENPMEGLAWDQISLNGFSRSENKALEGQTAAQIARQLGTTPAKAIIELFLQERGCLSMIVFSMSEDEVVQIMRYPEGMIGSDGCAVAPRGPMGERKVHPRFYGTFPRVLGRYVREQQVLPLEQAIHKMTCLPARKLRLPDRGLLKKGYHADLVVFDENQIADSATFQNPHQYPAGIHQVLVNGCQVVSEGRHTGRLPGRILKRA